MIVADRFDDLPLAIREVAKVAKQQGQGHDNPNEHISPALVTMWKKHLTAHDAPLNESPAETPVTDGKRTSSATKSITQPSEKAERRPKVNIGQQPKPLSLIRQMENHLH